MVGGERIIPCWPIPVRIKVSVPLGSLLLTTTAPSSVVGMEGVKGTLTVQETLIARVAGQLLV
jgi:hypothetical protein